MNGFFPRRETEPESQANDASPNSAGRIPKNNRPQESHGSLGAPGTKGADIAPTCPDYSHTLTPAHPAETPPLLPAESD